MMTRISLLFLAMALLASCGSSLVAAQDGSNNKDPANTSGQQQQAPSSWKEVAKKWAQRNKCSSADDTFAAQLTPDSAAKFATSKQQQQPQQPPPKMTAMDNSTGSGLAFACLRARPAAANAPTAANASATEAGPGAKTAGGGDSQKTLIWRVGVCALKNYTGAAIHLRGQQQQGDAPAAAGAGMKNETILPVEPFPSEQEQEQTQAQPGAGAVAPAPPSLRVDIGDDECRIVDGGAAEGAGPEGKTAWAAVLSALRGGRAIVSAQTADMPMGALAGTFEQV